MVAGSLYVHIVLLFSVQFILTSDLQLDGNHGYSGLLVAISEDTLEDLNQQQLLLDKLEVRS